MTAGKEARITKQERVYRAIRERILEGVYGPGYRVVIDTLAAEFGVSALPVREAIRRLEAEGLVVFRPNAGAQVSPAEPGLFDEEMTVLAVLEIPSAWPAPLLGKKEIQQLTAINESMVEAIERLDPLSFGRLDEEPTPSSTTAARTRRSSTCCATWLDGSTPFAEPSSSRSPIAAPRPSRSTRELLDLIAAGAPRPEDRGGGPPAQAEHRRELPARGKRRIAAPHEVVRALGPIGIWSRQLRFGDPAEAAGAAAELDALGYGGLWFPDRGGPVLDVAASLLEATSRIVVATGILNIWMHDPADVAAGHAELDRTHPDRFLLGLGIGHAPHIDADEPGRYRQPLATMRRYLDALDEHAPPGTRPARLIAALRPKMVALAGERTLGVHPYLMPVEHTSIVRRALGPGPLVAPTVAAVLEAGPPTMASCARPMNQTDHTTPGTPEIACAKETGSSILASAASRIQ